MNSILPIPPRFNFTTFREAVTRLGHRTRAVAVLTALALLSSHVAHAVTAVPFAWGNNGNGALGNGSVINTTLPVATTTTGVLAGKSITALSAGAFHCLALASDGTVYAWGDNTRGQLGNNSTTSVSVPVAVDLTGVLAGKTITAVAAGAYFSLALDSTGKVYAWGYNGYGTLGNNSALFVNALVPVAVDTTGVLLGKTVTRIAAGSDFALALTSDGKVFSWGGNGTYQLGNNLNNAVAPSAVDMTGVLSGVVVQEIAAGGQHAVVSAADGKLYAWGSNNTGQLGSGPGTFTVPVAVTLTGAAAGKSFTGQVAAGQSHSLALANTGELYAWGDGSQGQLGNGSTASSNVPVAVTLTGALAGQSINQIGTGYQHSVVITSSERVFAWGANGSGALGVTSGSTSLPIAVNTSGALSGVGVTVLGTGADATRSVVAGYLQLPAITTPPSNLTVTAGASASFTVVATGAGTYQWAKNGVDIPGATSATYTIASTVPTDAGGYSVIVSNSTGSSPSAGATLTVNLAAPVINTAPASHTVIAGTSTTFTVTATGTSLSYQWLKGGSAISGATSSSFTIVSTALTDAGSYTVAVTNTGGSVTSSAAILTVNLATPGISTQPASQTVNVGTSVTFTVTATGSSLSYQWKKAGSPISGATSSSFTIPSPALSDAGSYTVTITNTGGSITSNVATLIVNSPGGSAQSINFSAIPDHLYGDAPFTISASASSGLPVTFSVTSGPATVSGSSVTVNGIGSVTIQSTQAGNGTFNAAAPVSQSFTVRQAGAGIVFSTMKFTYDGSPKPTSVSTIPAGLSTALTYNGSPIAPSAAGSYTVTATVNDTNYSGIASATLVISYARPVFTLQPLGQNVLSGSSVTFAAATASVPAATYQWMFNGQAIAGATSAALTLPTVLPEQAGAYTVVATNPGGSVTSVTAQLAINADQRLANLSARAFVGSGENVAIAGFVIDGTESRPILLRAAGPALTDFGLSGVLAKPTLSLYQGSTKLATNTGWNTATNATDIANAATALGAFALKAGAADSALLITLPPGAYTAVVSGADTTGLALVEVYDTAKTSPGLTNLACRGNVGNTNQVFITGFTLSGTTPKKLLIRAVGPTLSTFGVAGALSDPLLQLYRGSTLVATNDNWNNDPELSALNSQTGSFPQTGAFPLAATSKDAAMLTTLESGGYTLVVSGVGGATGVVLVEVYQLQ